MLWCSERWRFIPKMSCNNQAGQTETCVNIAYVNSLTCLSFQVWMSPFSILLLRGIPSFWTSASSRPLTVSRDLSKQVLLCRQRLKFAMWVWRSCENVSTWSAEGSQWAHSSHGRENLTFACNGKNTNRNVYLQTWGLGCLWWAVKYFISNMWVIKLCPVLTNKTGSLEILRNHSRIVRYSKASDPRPVNSCWRSIYGLTASALLISSILFIVLYCWFSLKHVSRIQGVKCNSLKNSVQTSLELTAVLTALTQSVGWDNSRIWPLYCSLDS